MYMEKGPIRLESEKLVNEFNSNIKHFQNITTTVELKHLKNYSTISINCSTSDKKWFFHTVSRFVDDTDFSNIQSLLNGLETTFRLLDRNQVSITSFILLLLLLLLLL